MILYHGSNTDIKCVNLAVCRPYKDFGAGFYLTEIKEQAKQMANRVSKIYGGEPIINIYDIDESAFESSELSIKNFGDTTSDEWALCMSKQEQLIEYNIQDIIQYLVDDFHIEYDEAMNLFYHSKIFDKLQDLETGLYRESPAYIYGLLQDEMNFGKIIQVEI